MNERIKQLLSQAGVHYEVMPKDTVYEKFAKLIVQECAVVAGKFVYDNKYNEEGISEFLLKEEIKQHFGVE